MLRKRGRHEEGQALIIVVGAMTIVFVIGAVAVDVGLWLSERRSAQTVADLAALAASQELPNDSSAAIANAYSYADENGYTAGADGVQIDVALLCTNDLASPPAGICANGSAPAPSACAGTGCDAVRVTIRKPATHVFTSLLGLGGVEVSADATAVAGISAVPQGTLLLFDASGAMLRNCTNPPHYNNPGCFQHEAKQGAHGLVDLLAAGASLVGYVPYNNCYNDGSFQSPQGSYLCVPEADIVPPTGNAGPLAAAIDRTRARANVNICVPLALASGMLGDGPQSVVLLSGGDNIAYHDSNWPGVPASCRPASANEVELSRDCRSALSEQERELDIRTWQAALQLKSLGAEVYVIGLGVCGRDDGRTQNSLGYCAGIGDLAHDDIADQRLLKCIASSPEHYYPVTNASQLPVTFTDIATAIAHRGLLE